MSDQINLNRFIEAQNPVYENVLSELSAGMKTSHWMWYVFPQIVGLGNSPTAQKYAISGPGEAIAYLNDSILGGRLKECTRLVGAINGRRIEQIFGYPDYLKFRSSMTLFSNVSPDSAEFSSVLVKYFDGQPDQRTIDLLEQINLPG